MNLIVPPWPDRLSTRMDRTLRAVFAWCRTHAAGDPQGWHNRVYSCVRTGVRTGVDGETTVYLDANTRGHVDGWSHGR